MVAWKLCVVLIKNLLGMETSVNFYFDFTDMVLAFAIFLLVFVIPVLTIIGLIFTSIF